MEIVSSLFCFPFSESKIVFEFFASYPPLPEILSEAHKRILTKLPKWTTLWGDALLPGAICIKQTVDIHL